MSKLKPTAYMYPQYSGNGPDSYSEDEAGLVLADNINDLAEWEKKASAPLYVVPEGYALVPVEPTKEMIDSCHHGFMVMTEDTQWNDAIKEVYKQMIKAGVAGL